MTLRIAFQTSMREAAVGFLEALRDDLTWPTNIRLQVYRARPASVHPPTAFVDSISEEINYTGLNQRRPRAEIVVMHGLFDSGSAVDQRDWFVDSLIDYSFDHFHEADPNTEVAIVSVNDDPTFVPDWLPPAAQRTYYATRLTLEGLALSG